MAVGLSQHLHPSQQSHCASPTSPSLLGDSDLLVLLEVPRPQPHLPLGRGPGFSAGKWQHLRQTHQPSAFKPTRPALLLSAPVCVSCSDVILHLRQVLPCGLFSPAHSSHLVDALHSSSSNQWPLMPGLSFSDNRLCLSKFL